MGIVEMAILSTDLASYFEKRERFLNTANGGEFEWQVEEHVNKITLTCPLSTILGRGGGMVLAKNIQYLFVT